MVEFVDLEFGAHGFLINHVYLPTEQAETNICWIIYQDASFKICLSLFGWKVNILTKMRIVQWPKQIWNVEKIYTVYAKCLPSFNANFRILPKINLDIKCLSNKKSQESERGALCSQSFKKLRRKGLPVDLTTIMVTKLFECWWWLDSEAPSPL